MRLWLRARDEGLRRALADLLVEAGHDVSTALVPPDAVDLQVLAEEAGTPPRADAAALYLRPSPGREPDPEPSLALRLALTSRGVVVWRPPFDPGLLLETLSVGTTPRRREELPMDAPVAAAPSPWLLFDPRGRTLLWANGAALANFGLSGHEIPGPLVGTALSGLAAEVFQAVQATKRVDLVGKQWLAAWWTDRRERRCLGLLELPPSPQDQEARNQRALAEIGRMTSTLAHEIRNPVASLAGAVDLLEQDLVPAEREEIVAMARGRLGQMKSLLDDVLRLARPLKGPPTPFDPGQVIRSAAVGARTDPLFKGVDVRVEVGRDTILAVGHEEPVRQAVTNLLLNAGQAQKGRGTVTASLSREEGWAVIRVRDEGPGIPPDLREKVFEAFWTTKPGGTGLGLAFVRRVADAAGGRVYVEPSDRGACLRIDLPLAPTER